MGLRAILGLIRFVYHINMHLLDEFLYRVGIKTLDFTDEFTLTDSLMPKHYLEAAEAFQSMFEK